MRNTKHRWGSVARLFHWLVFALIIVQATIALIAADMPLGMDKLGMLTRHKSIGILVLLLVVFRLIWRWANPSPSLPDSMNARVRVLASVSHILLYCLMFAIPLSGWLMSSARGFPVSFFGLFQLPDIIEKDKSAFEFLQEIHGVLMIVLSAVVLLHLVAALRHHFFLRDDVLTRMLPFHKGE